MKRRHMVAWGVVVVMVGCAAPEEEPRATRISSTGPGQVLARGAGGSLAASLAQYLGRGSDDLALAGAHVGADGVVHARFEQRLDGVRVYSAGARASVTSAGALVQVIDGLIASRPAPTVSSTPEDALRVALATHGYAPFTPLVRSRTATLTTWDPSPELFSAPSAERVVFVTHTGQVRGGYLVETWSLRGNQLHETLVDDALTVVEVEARTRSDSYNVFVESPLAGPQQVQAGPGAGNDASPIGWLAGDQRTTAIQGNNAHAYLDAVRNNRPDRGGTPVLDGQFLAVADLASSPATTGNREVAVQNLFYLNNVVHDVLYRNGFTEAAGNFQDDNFGLGGLGADRVLAEAQDGSGFDNANFATPPDGRSPRMQMFLWSSSAPTHEVVTGGDALGAVQASFGANLDTTGVTAPLHLVDDGVGVGSDACEPIGATLTGQLAVVSRGTCDFVVKVRNAQNAGARAVVVVNNVPGQPPFPMGGTDRRIRISAVMVSFEDGALLQAGASATARKLAVAPPPLDADLDADVVFHEYGHGLTWRMIGSMSGPLAGAVGEGASDVLAFLLNGDDRMGEYLFPAGIRRAPYTNYPLTYAHVAGISVHDDGEIFAAAMWRLRERFLDAGLTEAQLLALFVDGMNYTPPGPAFEHMRDGLLQSSATRFGGAYDCLIWAAFAQYGIGVGASGVVTSEGVRITQSFAVPPACAP